MLIPSYDSVASNSECLSLRSKVKHPGSCAVAKAKTKAPEKVPTNVTAISLSVEAFLLLLRPSVLQQKNSIQEKIVLHKF